ncbi:MAG: hypothetical protein HFE86_08735, partial [Clostridiales bacterium]|nr:hypothetical protein [Clostridiales bacterium]
MKFALRRPLASALAAALLASSALTGGSFAMSGAAANTAAPMSYLKGDISSSVYVNSISGAAAQEASKLFDHKADTVFAAASAPTDQAPAAVSFKIFYAETVRRYALVSGDDPAQDPKSWVLYGRNQDGEDWTAVDSQESQTFSQRGERKVFDVASPASYSQYKLEVTGNNGGGGLRLAELQIATGEDVNLHLTWPAGAWNEGTPQDWAVNASEEVKTATLEAFNVAYNRLLDAGYNIGRERFGGGPNSLGAWSNYVNLQCEGSFNDNPGDPWNMNRNWGMLVAARPGVVFAVKGNLAKTCAPTLIAYGNDIEWTDPATGKTHIYQVFSGNTTVKKDLDGTDAGWPGYGAGTGAPKAVQAAMEEAYIQSGWYNGSFGAPYNLGFPAGRAQEEDGVWFQEFFGNDSTGSSPQAGRNGDYGISYLVGSEARPDEAYIVTDGILTVWASTWENVDSGAVDRFSATGRPVGNQFLDQDGSTVQEFEKARIQLSPDGTAQVFYKEGRFESLALTGGAAMQNALTDGQSITILAKEGADLTKAALEYTLCAGTSCDTPSGAVQDFSEPVDFTLTSYNGTKTVYTITILTPASIPAEERAAAKEAEKAITALPDSVYLNHEAQVDAAQAAYNALTPAGKLLISGQALTRLQQAVETIRTLGRPIRITCVGDSITEGVGVTPDTPEGKAQYGYPAQLQALLGDGYEVFNAGVSATNVIKKQGGVGQGTTFPYWTTARYTQGKEFKPDIAIIMLGINDASTRNWKQSGIENIREVFKEDYRTLVREYKELGSYVFIVLPTTCYGGWVERMPNMENDIIPALQELAQEENTGLIDMHTFTADKRDWFPDDLHPGNVSYGYFAAEFARHVRNYVEQAAAYELADLTLNGSTIADFDPAVTEYTVKLEEGEEIPEVAAAAAYAGAGVTCSKADSRGVVRISVTSADGRYQQIYSIAFQGGVAILPGDLNADGRVTIQDVMEACKVLARQSAGKA